MWFSCFCVLPCSAEAQVIWGGIIKRLLIAHFISNISAKKISKSIHVRQSYSKPKVGRFLRHGVVLYYVSFNNTFCWSLLDTSEALQYPDVTRKQFPECQRQDRRTNGLQSYEIGRQEAGLLPPTCFRLFLCRTFCFFRWRRVSLLHLDIFPCSFLFKH